MTAPGPADLRLRGLRLEYATLAWNVVGSAIVLVAAVAAHSVALAGFGLDSLIEILASLVVVWQLQDLQAVERERRALRIIGIAFLLLALYIAAQSIYILATANHPHHSIVGIAWLALTAVTMFALAAGKRRAGRQLGNRVLETEARVTTIDGLLATAVLLGLILNAAAGLWWADPAAAFVIVYHGTREGLDALRPTGVSVGEFLSHTLRAGTVLARDRRIPRPIRWLAAIGLLPIPGPVDEVVLVLVVATVAVFYRRPLREAWQQTSKSHG